MVYKFNEYSPKYSIDYGSIRKNIASKKFINIIFTLLNEKKYPDIETFYSANKDIESFIKVYLDSAGASSFKYSKSVFSHFSETMTNDDYQRLIKSIIDLTNQKRKFDSENINQQRADDIKIVSYNNVDKSYNLLQRDDEDFIKKLERKQEERDTFHTTDEKENAKNMFDDLSNKVNETLNLVPLKDLISRVDTLSEEQVVYIRELLDYIDEIDGVKVDLDRKIAIGKDNKVIKDGMHDVGDISNKESGNSKEKGYQKVLSSHAGVPIFSGVETQEQ